MKTRPTLARVSRLALGALAVWSLTACAPSAPEAPSAPPPPAAPVAPGTAEAPREVTVVVTDAMKFSLTRIDAAPGETIRLLLVNKGSAPKDAMGHNWVLLKAGVDATAFVNDAVKARAEDYLPAARLGDVIAHTKLLGGGGRDAVVFTVPAEPGDYTYVCTFPAHLQLGMKGVLSVK